MTRPEGVVPVPVFRSRQFLLRLGTPQGLFDVLRVIFMKDGSFSVTFAAFHDTRGVAAKCLLSPAKRPQEISLKDGGRVTSHLVKFTHHESGIAHFSLTKKVKSDIRLRAVPLAHLHDHCWTAMVRASPALRVSKRPVESVRSTQEQVLTFNFIEPNSNAFKFVAYHYQGHRLADWFTPIPSSASFLARGVDGRSRPTVLIASPVGWHAEQRAMVISAEDRSEAAPTDRDHAVFLGGFDASALSRDATRSCEFLALSYPAEDFDSLSAELGSIDIVEPDSRRSPT